MGVYWFLVNGYGFRCGSRGWCLFSWQGQEMNLIFDNIIPARRARRTDPETSHTAARNAERFAA
jgi:hypothetical protein